jgi:hypothetical protein
MARQRQLCHASLARCSQNLQDGRIYIEKLNGPFLYIDKGSPAEYSAGLNANIFEGYLRGHRFSQYFRLPAFPGIMDLRRDGRADGNGPGAPQPRAGAVSREAIDIVALRARGRCMAYISKFQL